MKIDPHVHSKGISLCSATNYTDLINEKKSAGYDGIVLTNHCQPWYYEKSELKNWINRFLTEYNQAKTYGDLVGFKVFLGVEVSVGNPHWSDFLLYGCDEKFFLNAPSLYELTQEQLFEYCNQQGVLMVQAHPFREGHSPCEAKFMHGVEINLRPQDFLKREAVEDFAKQNNLFVTCGSDYHVITQTEFGGIIIPDTITNSKQLAEFMREKGETTLFFENEVKTYRKN